MKAIITLLAFLCCCLLTVAQGEPQETGTDLMLSHHKILVVLVVLAIILTLLFGFLFWIERRLTKLEG